MTTEHLPSREGGTPSVRKALGTILALLFYSLGGRRDVGNEA